mgnify:FL=1
MFDYPLYGNMLGDYGYYYNHDNNDDYITYFRGLDDYEYPPEYEDRMFHKTNINEKSPELSGMWFFPYLLERRQTNFLQGMSETLLRKTIKVRRPRKRIHAIYSNT